jgi:hypothetical protein
MSPNGEVKVRVDGTPKNPGDRARDIRGSVDRYERDRKDV